MMSAIIPARNAGARIETVLASLAAGGGDVAGEIIVVDGGSTDDTVLRARKSGASVVETLACRGAQLAEGARQAKTDWLLFLHADTVLEQGWAREAQEFMCRNEGKAAFFRFAPVEIAGWRKLWLTKTVAWRCRWLALPYGDQGLLIARELYETLGGYQPLPLMEDVAFIRRIGRKRLHGFTSRAFTVAEKHQRGFFRRIIRNALCLGLYFVGVPPSLIARLYG